MTQKKKPTLRKNCNGTTAVEFALIFPIFILIIFSIIEFGMIMFVRSVLSSSALEAGRFGATGSIYGQNDSSGKPITRVDLIKNTVNNKMSILPFYDPIINPVRIQLSSLGKIDRPSEKAINGTAGKADEVIEYKIIYQWNILSPIMYPILGMDGKYEINAGTVVKNESF